MSRLRRSVPSLGALAAFEAAARLGGFTRAANELGVTQAAISRHIRTLEADLGTPLFVRTPRQVTLTDAGRTLADAVSDAFHTMSGAIDALRAPLAPTVLTVATSLSFSHFWLLARLPAFRQLHPLLQLRVLAQDTPSDLRHGDADVAIRYGRAPFADGVSIAMLDEEVFPVAGPAFAAGGANFAAGGGAEEIDIETLLSLPLIETHVQGSPWISWQMWFSRLGRSGPPPTVQLAFNHYSDAIYAAMAGEGVVLGWRRILERPLEDGRLVRVGTEFLVPDEAHHVVVANPDAAKAAAMAFARWMEEEFGAAPSSPFG